ncbi:hypothetical protein HELRODRAFT_184677 [Helobdella robusta]|uniref:Uncharacterized protein n=1 Tax=Helobdella robusta TaxID=6412 RepID=T1FLR1_HELRO|nr:hypothetical protein HELRODRAFT_184677 [Helobdella robusta]ESO06738.1 hypothetical protein HELRODRAFT_184677 [Helobdella robusta]
MMESQVQAHIGGVMMASRPLANPAVHLSKVGKWEDDIFGPGDGSVVQMRAESNVSMAIIYSAHMIRLTASNGNLLSATFAKKNRRQLQQSVKRSMVANVLKSMRHRKM